MPPVVVKVLGSEAYVVLEVPYLQVAFSLVVTRIIVETVPKVRVDAG